jgi:hypothetical protein
VLVLKTNDIFRLTIVLGNNQRIYTYEEGEWMMKGRYELAMRRNEELVWSKEDGQYTVQILIVSNILYICNFRMQLNYY